MSTNKQKIPIITNLCYIIKGNKVLLQKKARGFGAGKWNAPGGKKEPNETVEQSTIREVFEETNLKVEKLEYVGFNEFIFVGNDDWNNTCHIYKTSSFRGKPKDMGEGELQWFDIEKIPLEQMWDDDKFWTKEMLKGSFSNSKFFFDDKGNYLKHQKIN